MDKPRYLLLIALLLLAFWLRIDALDQLPPGMSRDEATNAVDAWYLAHTGHMPLYEDFGRPEPLFRLIQAVGMLLYGPSAWAMRLTSAFVGVLTVATAYGALREILRDLPPTMTYVGGFAAAAMLVVSLGHITLSRSTYRGLPQPLLMFLFSAFLLRGLRTDRWRDLVFAGVTLAAALYTYTAALMLPAALGFVGVGLLLFQMSAWRKWLLQLFVVGAVAGLILLPVGYLVLTNPTAVLGRTDAVEGGGFSLNGAVQNIAGQLLTRGDENPQYNTAYAPLISSGFQVWFLMGLVMLIVRVRQPSSWLILSFLVLGGLPVVLANEGTHGLRIIGEYAAAALVIGVGVGQSLVIVDAGLRRFLKQKPRAGWVVHAIVVVALVMITGIDAVYANQTYHASWQEEHQTQWAIHDRILPHGEWFFRTDLFDFADWIMHQNQPVVIPASPLAHSAFRTALMPVFPVVQGLPASSDDGFVLPRESLVMIPWQLGVNDLLVDERQFALLEHTSGMITLLPPLSDESHAALLDGIDVANVVMRDGVIDTIGRWQTAPVDTLTFESVAEASVVLDESFAVVGWYGDDILTEGAWESWVDWHTMQPVEHAYSTYLQIWTQDGQAVAGDEGQVWRWSYPTYIWPADMTVSVPYTLNIPDDLLPGAYQLVTGAYIFVEDPLLVSYADAAVSESTARIGWLKVPQAYPPALVEPVFDVIFADAVTLPSAHLAPQDDGTLLLTLDWLAVAARPNFDATIFVHLADADGNIIDQDDQRPHYGQYPMFIWDEGEAVQTTHVLMPDDTALDDLSIYVGLYTQPDFSRLPAMQDGDAVQDNRVLLGDASSLLMIQH